MARRCWPICTQQDSRGRKALVVCVVSILVLLVVGVIKSCHLLCCTPAAISAPLRSLRSFGPGFQVALQNSVQSDYPLQPKRRWWQPFAPDPKKEALEEALAAKAVAALQDSFTKERKAQDTVKAVLHRREIKHKKLLKGLEDGGWNINLNERSAHGPIQTACTMLETYLQSETYRSRRASRAKLWRGRGIAMAAGHALNLANAYVTLHMLRKVHNSTLPVEIFFDGEKEFDAASQRMFEDDFPGVRCIDVSKHNLPDHMARVRKSKESSDQQDGWMTKSQMLYLTSFEEVLVLDSDNLPLRDPAFLFESNEYRTSGNLFWPDFWTNNFLNPGLAYKFLGLSNPWAIDPEIATTESGQFLVDRRRHDDVLEWVVLLNLQGETLYDLVSGDKDTYRLAFHLARKANLFTQIPHRPSNALRAPHVPLMPAMLQLKVFSKAQNDPAHQNIRIIDLQDIKPPTWYSHAGMIQMDPDGNMLFLHRTADAKLNPLLEYPWGFESLEYMTTPLSARQAAVVHLSGAMDLDKFDTEKPSKCPSVQGLGLTQLAAACDLLDSGTTETMPGDISRSYPVPLFGTDEFPELQSQLLESMQAFRHLQRLFLSKTVMLGSPEEERTSKSPPPAFPVS